MNYTECNNISWWNKVDVTQEENNMGNSGNSVSVTNATEG